MLSHRVSSSVKLSQTMIDLKTSFSPEGEDLEEEENRKLYNQIVSNDMERLKVNLEARGS